MNKNRVALVLVFIAVILIASAFVVNENVKMLKLKDAPVDCHVPNDPNTCPLLRNSVEPPVLVVYLLGAALIMFSIYLYFFEKQEQSFVNALNLLRQSTSKEEKFQSLMHGLDEYEQSAVKVIRGQDGIKQGTLAIKTGMSKSKLCAVLQGLEHKNLIARSEAGRSKKVFIKNLT